MEVVMNVEELEVMVRNLQEQVGTLQAHMRTFQDIEEIKKLQRAYGYYLDCWMTDELVDLFSDSPNTVLLIRAGEFRGKEGIRRFFKPRGQDRGRRIPGFLHQVMQLSPIIDIAPDGKTAKGRWYGFGANASPVKDGVFQGWMDGVYENEYVKENGKWKIKKIDWNMYFFAPYTVGWVEPERQCNSSFRQRPPDASPDGPPKDTLYTSSYICPFHFEHPITGRQISVNEDKK
jgi:hypothetical protein